MPFIPVPRRHKNTPLTIEERREIKRLIEKGRTLSLIASMIERGKNTVVNEVRRNGGREQYDPEKANQEAHERRVVANEFRREIGRAAAPQSPMAKAFERIEALEMHVEILTEEIRRLTREIT